MEDDKRISINETKSFLIKRRRAFRSQRSEVIESCLSWVFNSSSSIFRFQMMKLSYYWCSVVRLCWNFRLFAVSRWVTRAGTWQIRSNIFSCSLSNCLANHLRVRSTLLSSTIALLEIPSQINICLSHKDSHVKNSTVTPCCCLLSPGQRQMSGWIDSINLLLRKFKKRRQGSVEVLQETQRNHWPFIFRLFCCLVLKNAFTTTDAAKSTRDLYHYFRQYS